MCGIFGITASKTNIIPQLLTGLNALSYRGYDSVGLCTLSQNTFMTARAVGDAAKLPSLTKEQASIGIGHTRWATHGSPSIKNAHPIISHDQVAVVHNGIITNHLSIKKELLSKGYIFYSQTDTEVIAHFLHQQLQHHPPVKAITKLQDKLQGRYALVLLLSNQPNSLYLLCNNMPLIIGKKNNQFAVSSDIHSLSEYHDFAYAPNQQPIEVTPHHISASLTFSPIPISPSSQNRNSHQHVTLSEIMEQSLIPTRLNNYFSQMPIQTIPKTKKLLMIACGSSLHCANMAKSWFTQHGVEVNVEIASEYKDAHLADLSNTILVAISQSGETADTLICMERITQIPHQHSIAICNTAHSALTRICDTTLMVQANLERGVASTKAVTAQLLTLYLLSCHLSGEQRELPKALPGLISRTLEHPSIETASQIIAQHQHILCIGKRSLFPAAQEFALKLKELTYIQAEGIAAGELKHGALALIDSSVLTIALDDRGCANLHTNITEIRARGGKVLLVSPYPHPDPAVLHIPYSAIDPLSLIPLNICCQLLSYYTALILGRPIDQPRNLAKSVTVE